MNVPPPPPPAPPVSVTVAEEHPVGTVTKYGPPGVEYDTGLMLQPIVLVEVEVVVEVDDVEVEVVEVEVEDVEDVDVEEVDVDVRCMFDDWEVTLVIIFPL